MFSISCLETVKVNYYYVLSAVFTRPEAVGMTAAKTRENLADLSNVTAQQEQVMILVVDSNTE